MLSSRDALADARELELVLDLDATPVGVRGRAKREVGVGRRARLNYRCLEGAVRRQDARGRSVEGRVGADHEASDRTLHRKLDLALRGEHQALGSRPAVANVQEIAG